VLSAAAGGSDADEQAVEANRISIRNFWFCGEVIPKICSSLKLVRLTVDLPANGRVSGAMKAMDIINSRRPLRIEARQAEMSEQRPLGLSFAPAT